MSTMYKKMENRIKLLNIYVDNLTMEETLDEISSLVEKRQNAYVVTPNVDHMVTLEKDEEFQRIYQEADLILTDGKPLIWISKLLKTPIKEKISGSDLFPRMVEQAAKKGHKMFFLGAREGVAKKAAEVFMEQYPTLQVVGVYSPSYGFEKKEEEIADIIAMIQEAKPDILVVGVGAPKQEKFIYRYRDQLQVPVSLGLGASFDFVAGTVKRAPRWMSEHGLEWLYRTFQEPKRLAKRYIVDAFMLLKLLWKYRT